MPSTAGPLSALHFSRDDLRQLEYAGMLHDFGKVGVREHVLVKAKKLYDWQLAAVSMRFRLRAQVHRGRGLAPESSRIFQSGAAGVQDALAAIDADLGARTAVLDECWRLVLAADEPTLMDRPALARLHGNREPDLRQTNRGPPSPT